MNPNPITRRTFALSSIALAVLALSSFATISAAEQPIPKPDGKPADMTKPVQVFILMGQSNMVGMGRIDAAAKGGPEGSLELAVKTKMKYPYLVDEAGNWSVRKDVRFVRMMQGKGLMNNEWLGVAQPDQIIKSTTIGVEFG
ncbi:MAG: sialate O-acetylesterase, partial [Verrucomicrobia bacterium]|nr:sialate O-acetylesterase [Verrucomicrobiota bacterium]